MSWLPATFGLLGVVVGALVTGGVELGLQRHAESNAIAIAKRLIVDELHNIWTHLDLLVSAGVTPQQLPVQQQDRFLPTADWDARREVLASRRALNDDEWTALTNFMHSVSSLRTVVFALPSLSTIPAAIDVTGLRDLCAELFEHYAGVAPADLAP